MTIREDARTNEERALLTDEEKLKVLIRIVDDDEEVREALTFLLACRGWRTIAYESAEAFLREYCSMPPGCILLDIRMPGMTGVELQQRLRAMTKSLPIIFVTGHGDVATAVKTVKAGAFDFLEKPVDGAVLEKTIERAVRVSLAESEGLLTPDAAKAVYAEMSPREREVLTLLAESLSNREMAARLGLSERTVEGHRNNVYRKLRVHNAAQLANVLRGIFLN